MPATPSVKTGRSAHSPPSANAAALERTLDAMRAAGRLEDIDESLVATARGLAVAVDADSANASLWKEYRAAQQDLRGLDRGDDDIFADLLGRMQAEVVDSPPPTSG